MYIYLLSSFIQYLTSFTRLTLVIRLFIYLMTSFIRLTKCLFSGLFSFRNAFVGDVITSVGQK